MEIKLIDDFKQSFETGLVGHIDCSYKQLVSLLGEPNLESDGVKSDAEWLIELNGKILTIYNYKDGKNYLGEQGLGLEDIREWHIGAKENVEVEMEELRKRLSEV